MTYDCSQLTSQFFVLYELFLPNASAECALPMLPEVANSYQDSGKELGRQLGDNSIAKMFPTQT